ncbi:MAG TPA: hypothetical protein VF128_11470 [Gemmatimonadaceae bacterium]
MRSRKRLDRVDNALFAAPIQHDLLTEAFQEFRRTGDLPEELNLARAVTRWALYGESAARTPPKPRRHDDGPSIAELICQTVARHRPLQQPKEG